MKKPDITDGILNATFEIGRVLRRRMLSAAASGIHMGQLHALALIHEHDGITMIELAQTLSIASPSATSFADRLVELRYVKRKADKKNRKLVLLGITPLGEKMLKKSMAMKRKIFARVLSSLSSQQQHSLFTILTSLLQHNLSA